MNDLEVEIKRAIRSIISSLHYLDITYTPNRKTQWETNIRSFLQKEVERGVKFLHYPKG